MAVGHEGCDQQLYFISLMNGDEVVLRLRSTCADLPCALLEKCDDLLQLLRLTECGGFFERSLDSFVQILEIDSPRRADTCRVLRVLIVHLLHVGRLSAISEAFLLAELLQKCLRIGE